MGLIPITINIENNNVGMWLMLHNMKNIIETIKAINIIIVPDFLHHKLFNVLINFISLFSMPRIDKIGGISSSKVKSLEFE